MPEEAVLELIRREEIDFIDLRFTDLRGMWHGVTMTPEQLSLHRLKSGVPFDGSSYDGWTRPSQSDLVLIPDLDSAFVDPTRASATLVLLCGVETTDRSDFSVDPRSVLKRAEDYASRFKSITGASVGAELEFFLFDDVRYENEYNRGSYYVDDVEAQYNSNQTYAGGNLGNRSILGQGLHDLPPADRGRDVREAIVKALKCSGVEVTKLHREGAAAQHEIGLAHGALLASADKIQVAKYVARNAAFKAGKSLTFMPKPIALGSGSGTHINVSLNRSKKNIFAGEGYGGLARDALYFIGGLLHHGAALNALCNASTNSYKRLVPMVSMGMSYGYGYQNRKAIIRVPHFSDPADARIEVRFPDATANPYLAIAAIVMAGLDGIENSIDPGRPQDESEGLTTPPPLARQQGRMAAHLGEALAVLNEDREFLMKGGVFSNALINAYLIAKNADIVASTSAPTPVEFQNYYAC